MGGRIENDRIKHIIEKPSLLPSSIVCAGAFILRPLVFEYIKS
jgi:dTDP-glucose pyrophosphorylase